jgi:hypothetical protein
MHSLAHELYSVIKSFKILLVVNYLKVRLFCILIGFEGQKWRLKVNGKFCVWDIDDSKT